MRTLTILLILVLTAPAFAAGPPPYQPGDILATRNATEAENSSPGHWNHLAVYVGNGQVVEAQRGPGVIVSGFSEFIARYPEILVLRLRSGKGQAIADEVWRHVGTPYAPLASVPRFLRRTERGNNCVSVARRGATAGIGRDPRWRKPDDAVADRKIAILFGKG